VLLVAVGGFLFKRGRWPRRTGDTPHCRKCDYILSGAQTRCPECGTAVTPAAIVRGERLRRPGLSWLGGGLALLGLAFLLLFALGFANTINWNRYKPQSWLLTDLGSGNSSRWGPAWAEVKRRLDDNLLSEDDQNAVVEKGLQLQAAGKVLSNGNNVLDFIARRFLDGKLTAAQADRFFGNAMKVSLSVRPVVGAQSPIPYSIAGAGHGPDGWWMRIHTLDLHVDDGPDQKSNGVMAMGFGGWSTSNTLPQVGTPGKHRLHLKMELATDVNGSTGAKWDVNAAVARRVTQDLFADFQAIDGKTPMTTASEPSASALGRLLTARLLSNPPWYNVGIDTNGVPVDVAFDIFVRANGKEFPAGGVSIHRNAPGNFGTGMRDFPADAPANVDIILRSSEDVARTTLDMTQIWKGEIVLKGVPLQQPPAASPATTPAAVP
jgi:hypothetical protein